MMKRLIPALVFSVGLSLLGCSGTDPNPGNSQTGVDAGTTTPSQDAGIKGDTSAQITSWEFSEDVSRAKGTIDQTAHTITVLVPYTLNKTSLTPIIGHTDDTYEISPQSGEAQDFTSPRQYKITGNDQKSTTYTVSVLNRPDPTGNLVTLYDENTTGVLSFFTYVPGSTDAVYREVVDNSISQLHLKAEAESKNPTTTITFTPPQPSALAVGKNTITVLLDTHGGFTKTWTVEVTRLGPGETWSSSIGILKEVPAGSFEMTASAMSAPIVSSVSGFHIGRTPVTRAQWTAITGLADPSEAERAIGSDDPVSNVTWYEALLFCNALSRKDELSPVYSIGGSTDERTWGAPPTVSNDTWNAVTADLSADGYRLPTEMEYEWAAMGAPADGQHGGTNTAGRLKAFAGSDGSNSIADYAWTYENSKIDTVVGNVRDSWAVTHPVGTKLPNELGLYDMSGNVWEWCWDSSANDALPAGPLTDYQGASTFSTYHLTRGGSVVYGPKSASVANRYAQEIFWNNTATFMTIGFRVVRK